MKLQHKAWALVILIVGIAAGSAMLGARYIVGESFSQLEFDRAEREGERARRILDLQLDQLVSTTRDYAYWDDTVDYVLGRKPDYPSENFASDSLESLRVSEVLLMDGQGQVLVSASSASDGAVAPMSAQRVRDLQSLVAPVRGFEDPRRVVKTLHVANGRLELVAAAAVLSPRVVPAKPQGVLVMVRRFEGDELVRFFKLLMLSAQFTFEKPGHDGHRVHLVEHDDGRQDLHTVLYDDQGRPVAELVLGIDDQLAAREQVLALQGMGLAVLAGLVAAVLLVRLLDRLILKRLQRLHSDLQRVTSEGPTASDGVRVSGNDELAQLGQGVNSLLTRVRLDAQTQREAHERQEALQVQLMQSQKTEALGRLTGGIAHDFNNSLAAITGWMRLAAEDVPQDHPASEALEQALKATRYADGLMRQLLAFGRQSSPRLRRLHWSLLIEETRQMVSSGLTKQCELVVNYHVDDDEVDADPTQLQQVLVNLLINAADAMGGSGRIELDLHGRELPVEGMPLPGAGALKPGRYLMLTVRDHGPGVPVENLDRVFEPFFTTKPKGKGTGLGLSVAQGIMARHQGGIGLSSTSDGAIFYLYLPVSRREIPVEQITTPGGPGFGRQLLFVDDDQSVRHAFSALLERKGWQVTRSRDGEEAWTHFSQSGKHWDVVLTDQSMPRLDGLGLAQRIHATASPPPVVLLSGHVDEVPSDQLRKLFAAVLHKPVDPAELHQVLQRVTGSGDAA